MLCAGLSSACVRAQRRRAATGRRPAACLSLPSAHLTPQCSASCADIPRLSRWRAGLTSTAASILTAAPAAAPCFSSSTSAAHLLRQPASRCQRSPAQQQLHPCRRALLPVGTARCTAAHPALARAAAAAACRSPPSAAILSSPLRLLSSPLLPSPLLPSPLLSSA